MKRDKTAVIVSDINVTPMVDVMLVLLIIFMVITPLLSKGQTVEYAKAKNAIAMKEADAEDAILVAITRNGETFLMPGNDKIPAEELPSRVSDLLTGRVDKTVYIKSDARARYGAVQEVVDYLRSAGVDELGLLTEPVHQEAPPQ
jgi:biopolymer transport protein ExbD/biopolymer transport protein TolR